MKLILTPLLLLVRRFREQRVATVSLLIFLSITMLSYILPLFYPYKYTELSNNTSEPPSLKHPFGTDSEGYDMVSRVLHGTVRSLNIANLTTLLSIGVGVIYALLIVESSKTLSYLMMRVIDVVLTIPLISLAILVVSEVSNGRGDWVIIAAVISSIYWPYVARVTYSNALSIAKQDFVAISRAIGASRRRIMFTHLLPNLINVITVNAVFTYLYAISVEVSLSYIGIGVRPPDVSLGLIVFQNESAAEMRPWLFYIPVIWILILTISAGFIGDGIRKSFQKVNNNNTWLIKK